MSKYEFVNPYNFVPLQKEKPQKGMAETGTYSGVIEYSLLTKTPLFIPNTSNEDAFKKNITDHRSYDFFSYEDLSEKSDSVEKNFSEPVIPGSSIRGVLRSNYEIMTNSCMSAIDDDDVLSKRTNETYKPGLLKKEGTCYTLWPAKDYLMRTMGEDSLEDDLNWKDDPSHNNRKCYRQKDLAEGQKVYFTKRERKSINKYGKEFEIKPLALKVSTQSDDSRTTGYVIKGEDGPDMNGGKQQKHVCHIFALSGNPKSQSEGELLREDAIGTLDKALEAYRNNGDNEYREYAAAWEKFRGGRGEEYFPVYYSSVQADRSQGRFVMLSPACITREIYQNTLSKMIPNHKSCDSEDKLCPACRLFGTLGKNFQVTSRVRVSDLRLSEGCRNKLRENAEQLFEKIVTLDPLGMPKINNMEFYVQRPEDAWFWTYDYYITKDGSVIPTVPTINGRKFYWHQMDVQSSKQEPDNLNVTVRPLKGGVTFGGKIYFDRLSKRELDELCYIIEAGDKDALAIKKHGYKLGHAKPLGYGSVAMHIDKVLLRKVVLDEEKEAIAFAESEYEERETPVFDNDTKSHFEKYTDFELLKGENIHYPKPKKPDKDGEYPIFGWFVENHVGYDRKKKKMIGMPNSRQQMVYGQYMEAMEPGLKRTGVKGDEISPQVQKSFDEVGEIKMISPKGFAFLKTPKGELFVHGTAFGGGEFDRLEVGMKVSFQRGKGSDGREKAVKAKIMQ